MQTQSTEKSLHMSKEDKFYTRLLSKETSIANPSFRVYYGGASGAVPFLWESQPGTPKNPIYDNTLPPLTPPPSYYSTPKSNRPPKRSPNKSTSLITTILPKLSLRKSHSNSSACSTSSASSTASSFSDLVGPHVRNGKYLSPRSSFSSRGEDDDSDDGSPTSTLCFGVRTGPSGRVRGCGSVVIMKNALRAIVGHGSSS